MFALHFDTNNAAFGDTEAEARAEIARILADVTAYVRDGGINFPHGAIRDANGNRIGEWKYMTAKEEK